MNHEREEPLAEKPVLRVLMAEDSELDAKLVLHEVRSKGYALETHRVDCDVEFRAALESQEWDLILCDYSMPGFDGLAALRIYQEAGLDIPFILVSGTVGEDIAVEAMRAGAHDYLMKDNLARLVPAIERELRESRMRHRERLGQAQLRQAQKLDSIGTLASGVAHEINNPIMGIMGYAEIIKDGVDAESKTARMADEIIGQTRRVGEIVKNLLRFARAEEAERRDHVCVADLVESTASLIQTVMRHDDIAMVINVPPELPTLICNGQQIQQVVMNLLTNARDALNMKYPERDEDKRIIVTASEIDEESGQAIRITVEDKGIGIPEDVQGRMFVPFFTTKSRDKGTGLGLSISHGIVAEHGGQMVVESAIGEWSRIHIDLPLGAE
jgi:signal transduction histidine kinase